MLKSVPDQHKTQEVCERSVLAEVYAMEYVPDQHKSQEMCAKAFERTPNILEMIAD